MVLANPSAAARNNRFVDQNLNRCVRPEQFDETSGYDGQRRRFVADLIENHEFAWMLIPPSLTVHLLL